MLPGFSPETAAAVGTRDLWVLGEYRCSSGWCLALVRSTDAGRHFTRTALPPFPSQGPDPTVVFADSQDGFAYVPYGTTPLYVTHDGGESWHAGPAGGVLGFATGGGWAYVATRRDGLERSPVSNDAWRWALRLTTQYPIGLAARGGRVWLVGPPRRAPDFDSIRLSSNHGLTFTTRPGPCYSELGGTLAAAGGVVWAVCRTDDGRRAEIGGRGTVVRPHPRARRDERSRGVPDLSARRISRRGRRWPAPAHHRRRQTLESPESPLPDRPARLARVHVTPLRFRPRPDTLVACFDQLWRTTDGGTTWHTVPLR